MNTLFRICVYYCIALLVFTLAFNLVAATGAFPINSGSGLQNVEDTTVLDQVTSVTGGMNSIFLGFTILTLSGTVILAWALHSLLPIAIYFFGFVFWSSFLSAWGVLTGTGFLGEMQPLFFIFFIVTVFIFIGAIIGMVSGSG